MTITLKLEPRRRDPQALLFPDAMTCWRSCSLLSISPFLRLLLLLPRSILRRRLLLWELWDLYAKRDPHGKKPHRNDLPLTPSFPLHLSRLLVGATLARQRHLLGTFAGLAVLSAFVMAGFLYRISALLLWLGFTYLFLLEKAVYPQPFYYLIGLLCFFASTSCRPHRAWSIDARIWPALRSDVVPAWTLWLLRFQIALPYVFGGIAKLNADWLQGQPMQIWLSKSVWEVLLGPVAPRSIGSHSAFSWGGLVLDLGMVPALLWRRSRTLAYCAAVAFSTLLNAYHVEHWYFSLADDRRDHGLLRSRLAAPRDHE